MLAALVAPTGAVWAQLERSELRGSVSDPRGSPIPGAQVVLLDQRGAPLQHVTCDAAGRFVFKGVAPGSYYLRAMSAPLVSRLESVAVGNALAADVELHLAARSAETLMVTPGRELPALATRTSLSGESVQDVPRWTDRLRGGRGALAR